MEPPTVKEEIKKENSYTIISDKNHSFNLNIQNLNFSIKIIAIYQDDIIKQIYEKKMLLEELKKNKFLGLCDSIDEIYDELTHNLSKNQTKILEETNQIYISIPIDHLKIKEILFVIEEKLKDDKEKIQELILIVTNLKQEIKELKNNKNNDEFSKLNEKIITLEKENSKLNAKIITLEKENSKINDKIITLEKENSKINEELNSYKIFLPYLEKYKKKSDDDDNKMIRNLDSLIIGNNEKYNITLKNWINPNIKIKSQLLYRKSRDGDEFQTFHKLCDNKGGSTLILIKLDNGNILGSYTILDWDSKSEWKDDLNMFAFSLTENAKCIKNNNNKLGIYCNPNYGPHTAIHYFNDKNKKMKVTYINAGYNSFNESNKLSKEKGYFNTQEVEIFKIL